MNEWKFNQLMGNWWYATQTHILIVARESFKNFAYRVYTRQAGKPAALTAECMGHVDAEQAKAAAQKWLEERQAQANET